MEKKEILLPEKRYGKAPSEELTINVNFDEQKSLLTNDDRDVILNNSDLFNKERNNSNRYKVYGKVKMVFRNMYYGLSEYEYLSERLALKGDGSDDNWQGYLPYNEFAFLRNDVVKQDPLIPNVTSLSGFTGFTVSITGTTGSTKHITLTPMNASYHNWNTYLSYADGQNSIYPMKYTLSGTTPPLSFVSGDGIPFRISDEGRSYKLTSPVVHGISEGEYIILNNHPYYVNTIGDEIYDSENYVINILKSQILSGSTTFTSNILITGKRCTDIDNISNTTSQYYIHTLKTFTSVSDYVVDKVGFEQSIWENERKLVYQNKAGMFDVLVERNRMETVLYDFKEPFVLTGITNNLGYTPTDVYVSLIFRNGNGYFEYPPKVGYKFNFHDTWIDSVFSGSTSKETSLSGTNFIISGITFTSGNTLPVGTELTGAFIEYIPTEMKERVISESFYKLTNKPIIFDYQQTGSTTNFSGATINNPFGLFYQPHHRVKLRELSPYVETSNSPDIYNMPQNARYFPDEKIWKWRDLYDHGYIDDLGFGTDNPYTNNTHYVKNDINLYLRNENIYTNKKNGIFGFNTFSNKRKDNINC
jgi:hypothetical protein